MEGDAENLEIPGTNLCIENAGKRYSYINRMLKHDQISVRHVVWVRYVTSDSQRVTALCNGFGGSF